MTRITILLFRFILISLNTKICAQDSIMNPKHKFEVSINYAMQRPFYSISTPIDIITFEHHSRYRSKVGMGLKYYVFNKWFVEYQTAFSQEGGGYKEQYTNANYWKNGFYLGFSSNHTRRVIFDFYTGMDINFLINAKFKNTVIGQNENVSDYYNPVVLSFPVLGLGLKTKIYDDIFIRAGSYLSMTNYRVSSEKNTNVSQVIIPAFQISFTKFIN